MKEEFDMFDALLIFYEDSSRQLLAFAAYALVVCAVDAAIEQRAPGGGAVWIVNLFTFAAALAVVTLSSFIVGWRSAWLGGEQAALWLTPILSVVLIAAVRWLAAGEYQIGLEGLKEHCLKLAAIIAAPLAAMHALILAWSKGN